LITKTPVKNVPGFKKITSSEYKKAEIFRQIIAFFEVDRPEKHCYSVYGDDLALMWKKFRKNYQLVTAGGGLVRNNKNKILFIYRNDKWDLPKGKAEPNELITETALREVKEECEIKNLIPIRHLVDTYHTYGSRMNRKLKKTSWFRMYTEDRDLQPQLAEGITRIKWVKEEKLGKILKNTYPNILEVIRAEINSQPKHERKEWHAMVNFE